MRNPCEMFIEWLETGSGELPPHLQSHLEQCLRCQQEYQLERRYQQVLQSVRSEPVPPTRLQWSQIAERMTPAKPRPRRLWRPIWAPALAIGLAFGFAIFVWSPTRSGTEIALLSSEDARHTQPAAGASTPSPDTPVSSEGDALVPAQPTYSDSVEPFAGTGLPAQPSDSESTAPASTLSGKRNSPQADSVPPNPSALALPTQPSGSVSRRVGSIPTDRESEPGPPQQTVAMGSLESGRLIARAADPLMRALPATLEPLKMEPIVPQGSENAVYLAVNYVQSQTTEAKSNDALICSF